MWRIKRASLVSPDLPVILGDGSQQLPAGACVKAADTARGLLDLGHLVLILEVDGLCELDLQEADDLIVCERERHTHRGVGGGRDDSIKTTLLAAHKGTPGRSNLISLPPPHDKCD